MLFHRDEPTEVGTTSPHLGVRSPPAWAEHGALDESFLTQGMKPTRVRWHQLQQRFGRRRPAWFSERDPGQCSGSKLAVVEACVEATPAEQFLVFALFDDVAFLHHQDHVCFADGR